MTPISNRIRTLVWLVCFACAFIATHLPPSKLPSTPWLSDKVEHQAGYFVLGCITAWRYSRSKSSKAASAWSFRLFLGLAAYGAFDELTQPLVGRTAEFFDWLADLSGALIGIGLYLVYDSVSRPRG